MAKVPVFFLSLPTIFTPTPIFPHLDLIMLWNNKLIIPGTTEFCNFLPLQFVLSSFGSQSVFCTLKSKKKKWDCKWSGIIIIAIHSNDFTIVEQYNLIEMHWKSAEKKL